MSESIQKLNEEGYGQQMNEQHDQEKVIEEPSSLKGPVSNLKTKTIQIPISTYVHIDDFLHPSLHNYNYTTFLALVKKECQLLKYNCVIIMRHGFSFQPPTASFPPTSAPRSQV